MSKKGVRSARARLSAQITKLSGNVAKPGRPSRVQKRAVVEPVIAGPYHIEERLLCNKVLYAREEEADAAALKRKHRVYQCLLCGGWHTTSRLSRQRY